MTEQKDYHKMLIPIRSAIHSELVIKAAEQRRSTTNLIQKVLEDWVKNQKGGKDND